MEVWWALWCVVTLGGAEGQLASGKRLRAQAISHIPIQLQNHSHNLSINFPWEQVQAPAIGSRCCGGVCIMLMCLRAARLRRPRSLLLSRALPPPLLSLVQ